MNNKAYYAVFRNLSFEERYKKLIKSRSYGENNNNGIILPIYDSKLITSNKNPSDNYYSLVYLKIIDAFPIFENGYNRPDFDLTLKPDHAKALEYLFYSLIPKQILKALALNEDDLNQPDGIYFILVLANFFKNKNKYENLYDIKIIETLSAPNSESELAPNFDIGLFSLKPGEISRNNFKSKAKTLSKQPSFFFEMADRILSYSVRIDEEGMRQHQVFNSIEIKSLKKYKTTVAFDKYHNDILISITEVYTLIKNVEKSYSVILNSYAKLAKFEKKSELFTNLRVFYPKISKLENLLEVIEKIRDESKLDMKNK